MSTNNQEYTREKHFRQLLEQYQGKNSCLPRDMIESVAEDLKSRDVKTTLYEIGRSLKALNKMQYWDRKFEFHRA